jgi:hypothetical protein
MKSETGERIEKGRAERMAGSIDGDLVTSDSVSFYSDVSGVEMFCTVVCHADGGRVSCSIPGTRN